MERKITKRNRSISMDRNLNNLMEELISNKSKYIEYLIHQDLLAKSTSDEDDIKKLKL